jgi:TATA-binding protein-associated factor Taf7
MTLTKTHRTIATDSELALHGVIGDDATATFESDPKFVNANPGAEGSSENVEEQRETDDTEDSDEEIDDEDDEDAEEEEDDEEEEDEVEAAAATHR